MDALLPGPGDLISLATARPAAIIRHMPPKRSGTDGACQALFQAPRSLLENRRADRGKRPPVQPPTSTAAGVI